MHTLSFSAETGTLPRLHQIEGRPTTSLIQKEEGTIVELDAGLWGIMYRRHSVLPVNLPAALRRTGVRVHFSGELKQVSTAEFWAALPVVLTAIHEV